MLPRRPTSTLFPYTTLFRSAIAIPAVALPETTLRAPAAVPPIVLFVAPPTSSRATRSEEHTSELQSHSDLVCRLLLEKKKLKALATRLEITQPMQASSRSND